MRESVKGVRELGVVRKLIFPSLKEESNGCY